MDNKTKKREAKTDVGQKRKFSTINTGDCTILGEGSSEHHPVVSKIIKIDTNEGLTEAKANKNKDEETTMNQPQQVEYKQEISQDRCCKRYYKKRRFCCPGKRRYKAKVGKRCCKGYKNTRINLCNRNWARISIHPFINYLRCYRKRLNPTTPVADLVRKGLCKWRKLSCHAKQQYYEQAKRARIRGYRT